MSKTKQTIKYTATLSESSVDELKRLAEKKIIPSVNFAIREAVNLYIAQTKKELYEKEMQKAAKDKDYLMRTIESDKDFSFVDSEVGKDW
ncbi:MAG: ribbon-helix-helix protein, CopG family [Clostridiaceae bacterium]|jgi:metal-responsive CopG/Arc/MetJ family transcriptional regulator|nr:ribbon-helix-helix protein, CopG family [Clostridiaceae bacterium]